MISGWVCVFKRVQKMNLSFSDFDLHNSVWDTFPKQYFCAKYINTQMKSKIKKNKQTNKQKQKFTLILLLAVVGLPLLSAVTSSGNKFLIKVL